MDDESQLSSWFLFSEVSFFLNVSDVLGLDHKDQQHPVAGD
jgi:hypothetical protein